MTTSDIADSDEVWDLLDALEHFNSKLDGGELDGGEMASLEEALAYDPALSPAVSVASSGMIDYVDVPHLPPLARANVDEKGNSGTARTSEPISKGIKQNQEQTLLDMASKDRFEQLLKTHMGFTRFEEWIDEEGLPGSKQLLSYYKDLRTIASLFEEATAMGSGLQDVYFGKQAKSDEQMVTLSSRPSTFLPSLSSATLGMHTAQEEATQRLYSTEFKRFIAGKLTEQAKARLQFIPDHSKRGDLGEVFCIADPRLPDQPLVFISDAFCRLSEYPRDMLIGRNCRFLQGPETDRGAVKALRAAIEVGQEHCCLLLNYTRTGKPFWNLLNMIPLKNVNGAVEYLLGAQIDVTPAMSGSKAFKSLEDLVRGGRGDKDVLEERFQFSTELIKSAEKQLSKPLLVTQIPKNPAPKPQDTSTSPTVSYPGPNMVAKRKPSIVPGHSSPKLGSEKKSTWLSKLKKGGDVGIQMDSYTTPTLDTTTHSQITARIRDRMSTFSAAHSKLIIFDAKCGRIQYVTPPLLAYLRYPIRTHKDRLNSGLLRLDITDILTGETPTETDSIVKSVQRIVSTESTYSVFAGLVLSQTGRDAPDHIADAVTSSGKKYARSLLHLTPVKDRKDKSQMYVVVVG